MPETEQILTAVVPQEKALEFFLGGNSLFTIQSKTTGTRFTYKILRSKNDENYFKVMTFVGTDNTKDYKQMGYIERLKSPLINPVSAIWKTHKAFIALDHVYLNLNVQKFMPSLEIWHEGRCCKCGRVLTVPESIARGIGPECWDRINESANNNVLYV